MKLIDIVKDMNWPDGADCCVQDMHGCIKWIPGRPVGGSGDFGGSETSPDRDGDWWFFVGTTTCSDSDAVHSVWHANTAKDYETAIITKQDWENAQTKEHHPTVELPGGITLRQYYAGLAMQGIMSDFGNFNNRCIEFGQRLDDVITRWSLEIADALIKKLEETND